MDCGTIAGVPLPVTRMVQGTRLLSRSDAGACDAVFDAALEAGCRAFESAAVYDEGRAESVLGDWAARRGVRDEVVMVTKGCHPDLSTWRTRLSPEDVRSDVEASLGRLRTDRVDLYMLHRDDPSVPVGEVVSALDDEVRSGRVRAYGLSNWEHGRVWAAMDHALRRGLVPPSAASPGFSLARPERTWPGCLSLSLPEDEGAIGWYRASELPLLAWSPLAGGFLTGRFDRWTPAEDPHDVEASGFYGSDRNYARLVRLAAVSGRGGMTTAQGALAYVFSFPLNVFAVVGCRTPGEVRELAPAVGLRLQAEDIDFLHQRPV